MLKKAARKLEVHFSSKTDDWATPQALFDQLSKQYGPFDLDVCASHENAKCPLYLTLEGEFAVHGATGEPIKYSGTTGLEASWSTVPRAWMNPPYGREIGKWVKKAYEESRKGCLVVALLPARTDTRWFHECIYNQASVSYSFIRGRLKFGDSRNSAPFPSMVVVFNPPKA